MSTSKFTLSAVALGAAAYPAQAEVDVWRILQDISITEIVTEDTYEVRKSYPTALQDGAIEVEITGYAVPRYPGETVQDLILVSDMGTCPFCGSLDHGANLQVLLQDAIPGFEDSQRITLRGTLEPVADSETWQAAILTNAHIIR